MGKLVPILQFNIFLNVQRHCCYIMGLNTNNYLTSGNPLSDIIPSPSRIFSINPESTVSWESDIRPPYPFDRYVIRPLGAVGVKKIHKFGLGPNALSFYKSKRILDCPNCFGQAQITL